MTGRGTTRTLADSVLDDKMHDTPSAPSRMAPENAAAKLERRSRGNMPRSPSLPPCFRNLAFVRAAVSTWSFRDSHSVLSSGGSRFPLDREMVAHPAVPRQYLLILDHRGSSGDSGINMSSTSPETCGSRSADALSFKGVPSTSQGRPLTRAEPGSTPP